MSANLNSVKIRPRLRKRSGDYHHGDLRQSLIQIGVVLLNEAGPEQLSLRAIAKRAGVSQTAPYAHFEGKRALLIAIAAFGYEQLRAKMIEAADGSKSAQKRFLASGRGYVAFALETPALFRLMFSSALGPREASEELKAKSDEAYAVFIDALDAVVNGKKLSKNDAAMARVSAWSMIHGLATLLLERRLSLKPGSESEFAAGATEFYLRRIVG